MTNPKEIANRYLAVWNAAPQDRADALLSWSLAPGHGAIVVRSTDIVRLDGESGIVEVVGFLDGGLA